MRHRRTPMTPSKWWLLLSGALIAVSVSVSVSRVIARRAPEPEPEPIVRVVQQDIVLDGEHLTVVKSPELPERPAPEPPREKTDKELRFDARMKMFEICANRGGVPIQVSATADDCKFPPVPASNPVMLGTSPYYWHR